MAIADVSDTLRFKVFNYFKFIPKIGLFFTTSKIKIKSEKKLSISTDFIAGLGEGDYVLKLRFRIFRQEFG